MDGASNTYVRNETCLTNCSRETWREETTWETYS